MIKRIGFTVLAVLALSIAAQAADIDSGTWVFNVAKSTSSNGNLRRSGRQVVSYDGGWRIVKNDIVDKDGKAIRVNLIAKPDGVARPEIGNEPDAVGMLTTFTKSDDFHWKVVSVAVTGKIRMTQTVVISPDGKVKTNTTTRVDKDGKTSNSVSVFDKQ